MPGKFKSLYIIKQLFVSFLKKTPI